MQNVRMNAVLDEASDTASSNKHSSANCTSHVVILSMILLLALGLRVHGLGGPSFWFDEAGSVVTACGHWERLFDHVTGYFNQAPDLASPSGVKSLRLVWLEGDAHPPLYYFVLRGWWLLFGMSDVSCRALSVAASLLAIVVLFDVARLVLGSIPALWACALMAVAPCQVEYAQEARSYALLLLLGLTCCDAILRLYLLGPSRWRYAALTIFSTAALMTHYFIAGAMLAVILFALVAMRGRSRVTAVAILLASFVIPLSRLPLVLSHGDRTHISLQWLAETREGLLGRSFLRAMELPAGYLIRPLDKDTAIGAFAALLLFLPFYLNRRKPGLLLAGLWPCGVIGMVAASDVVLSQNALLYVRYTLAASPMVYLSFVAISDMAGRWTRHLLPVVAVIGALMAIPETYQSIATRKTEARELCRDIQEHVGPHDVLVISSSPARGLYAAAIEYDEIAFYAWPITCPVAILEAPPNAEQSRQINAHHQVWLAQCWGSPVSESALEEYEVIESFPMRYQAGRLYRVKPKAPSSSQ